MPLFVAVQKDATEAEQFQSLIRAISELTAAVETSRSMPVAGRTPYVTYSLSAILQTLVPHDALVLFQSSGTMLLATGAVGSDSDLLMGLEVPIGSGLVGWVAHNAKAVLNADPAVESGAGTWPRASVLKSTIAVPLSSPRESHGVLSLYGQQKDSFTVEDQQTLELLVSRLAVLCSEGPKLESTPCTRVETPDASFVKILEALAEGEKGPCDFVRADLSAVAGNVSPAAFEQYMRACLDSLLEAFPPTSVHVTRWAHTELAILVDINVDRLSTESGIQRLQSRLMARGLEFVGGAKLEVPFAVVRIEPRTPIVEQLAASERAWAEDRCRRMSRSLLGLTAFAGQPSAISERFVR